MVAVKPSQYSQVPVHLESYICTPSRKTIRRHLGLFRIWHLPTNPLLGMGYRSAFLSRGMTSWVWMAAIVQTNNGIKSYHPIQMERWLCTRLLPNWERRPKRQVILFMSIAVPTRYASKKLIGGRHTKCSAVHRRYGHAPSSGATTTLYLAGPTM